VNRRLLLCLMAGLLLSCDTTASRLAGRWETEETPKRTLELFQDGTFTQALTGKTLGFVSKLLGPVKGKWAVEGKSLVLTVVAEDGSETIQKLPINELAGDRVVLNGERWRRLPQ
jgi:hypothetical protein